MKAIRPDKRRVLSTEEAMAEVEAKDQPQLSVPYQDGHLYWSRELLDEGRAHHMRNWTLMSEEPSLRGRLGGYFVPSARAIMHSIIYSQGELRELLTEEVQKGMLAATVINYTTTQETVIHVGEREQHDICLIGGVDPLGRNNVTEPLFGVSPRQVVGAMRKLTGLSLELLIPDAMAIREIKTVKFVSYSNKCHIDLRVDMGQEYVSRGVRYESD
ncbi:hypothetical protein ACFL0V_01350 [Nanoarchaeota archaeon]